MQTNNKKNSRTSGSIDNEISVMPHQPEDQQIDQLQSSNSQINYAGNSEMPVYKKTEVDNQFLMKIQSKENFLFQALKKQAQKYKNLPWQFKCFFLMMLIAIPISLVLLGLGHFIVGGAIIGSSFGFFGAWKCCLIINKRKLNKMKYLSGKTVVLEGNLMLPDRFGKSTTNETPQGGKLEGRLMNIKPYSHPVALMPQKQEIESNCLEKKSFGVVSR